MRQKTFPYIHSLILFLSYIIFINFSFSQNKLTIKDYINFQVPSNTLNCSPDGSEIVFEIREANLEKNRYQRQIWHTRVTPFAPQKLFPQFEQSYHPQWCPTSVDILAFLAISEADSAVQSGRAAQLYLFDFKTNTTNRISNAPLGVEAFAWSPGGRTLAYVTQNTENLEQEKNQQKQGFDALIYESPRFCKTIRLFDLQSRINEKLYVGDPGIRELVFAPDGEMLVFSSNYSGLRADPNFDLWLLSVGSQQVFPLTEYPGEETNPKFAPGGQKIAFLGSLDSLFNLPQTDLFLSSLTGGSPKNLTEAFDFPVTEFLWAGSDEKIFFTAQNKTAQPVFEINLSTGEINPAVKNQTDGWFSRLARAGQTNQLFLLGETARTLPEIFQLKNDNLKQISDFSAALQTFKIANPEKIQWQTATGQSIEGWFLKPLSGRPPYPTIVVLHGGPFSAFKNRLLQNDYLQLYAQHGYAVFAPNPAGSSGYGNRFAREIVNQLGKKDTPQILAGLDHLIEEGLADSTRLGIVGGSYGGYLVNWIISQTTRFQAAVSLYGIFDLANDWGTSNQPIWQQIYLGNYYWIKPELYRELSPSRYVTQIQTPLLLLHGEDDNLTDLSNSKQAFRALKALGRDVELVIYPRENHGIQREPNHEINKFQRILEWFDRYLD